MPEISITSGIAGNIRANQPVLAVAAIQKIGATF